MITQFIKSNYAEAVKKQISITRDTPMIENIHSKSLSIESVSDFMQSYGLFQGIEKEKRIAMAQEFIQFVNDRNPNQVLNIEVDFNTLHTKLYYASGNRKCLSATSKLLWCMYPNDIVIYDAFVARAILILQCLDKDLASLARFDVPPQKSPDSTSMTQYYMSYYNLVITLFNKNKDVLTELRDLHPNDYKYDLRIFDKLLWMMGSFGEQIKLD